jgi:hypothetical protein
VITAADVDFHAVIDQDPTWGETNFFGFYVAERNLCGSVYVVARPQLGVASSHIVLYDKVSLSRKDCVYLDCRQHLPAPEKLSDYTLNNGLSVRAVCPPRDFELSYTGTDGTELDLRFDALMDPYDIHDHRAPGQAGDRLTTTSYKGHFDMTGRVTGFVDIRGERIDVDCIDTIDHSWGPKAENDKAMACWMHAHFGPDYVLHAILMFDPAAAPNDEYTFVSGYVLENGEVRSLTSGIAVASRADYLGITMDVTFTDDRQRDHRILGGTIAATNVPWFSSKDVHYALHRWTTADGRVGYGCVQESFQLDTWCRRNPLRPAI